MAGFFERLSTFVLRGPRPGVLVGNETSRVAGLMISIGLVDLGLCDDRTL